MTALEQINSWPSNNASAALLMPNGETHFEGSAEAKFALASVTKPLFGLAVLVAVEEGSLELDQPVNSPNSSETVTIRHLLSHASGLGPKGKELAKPGQRRIYSNYGFDLLGQELQRATELTPQVYFHEALVAPLGLKQTELVGSPAFAANSSVADLIKVCQEILTPTLLSAETMATATTPAWPELDGVLPGYGRQTQNLWGLGFEIRGNKSPHWTGSNQNSETCGHFGQAGTFMWIDPTVRAACVALTDLDFGQWAIDIWSEFNDQVFQQASN